jgi:hypothetical protein
VDSDYDSRQAGSDDDSAVKCNASTHRIVSSLEPISASAEPHRLSKQVPTADEAGTHAEAAWTAIRGACRFTPKKEEEKVGMNVQSLQTLREVVFASIAPSSCPSSKG